MTAAAEAPIVADLHRKIAAGIEELLERETALAQVILPPQAIVELILSISAGVTCTAISGAMQLRKPGVPPEEMFDKMLAILVERVVEHRPAVLDGIALIAAGKQDEARAKYGSLGR